MERNGLVVYDMLKTKRSDGTKRIGCIRYVKDKTFRWNETHCL
jgi:hypothetical protein